jgi:hydroxymethylpyrimidine pyrophosphatase-like HAD family hydrolase
MNKGRSKGAALLETASLLGLSVSNTYAVGDAENDISMITAAGTGIAVMNAVDEVKLAADYVTERDNNHDAVAELIEHLML